MKNPIASLIQRRRMKRRLLRDVRKVLALASNGFRSPVYVGDGTVFAPTHHGQWIYLATEDLSVCPRIMTTGTWEAGTTAFMQKHVRPGMNYVEVGANYGYFSLLSAALVGPDGRVDAFEPLPRAASHVRRTFLANGGANWCHLHECAVSDKVGASTLHSVEDLHGGGQLAPHIDVPGRVHSTTEVKTTTLDTALEGRHIDFLKMDAQGAEGLVLSGAAKTLEQSPNIMMVLEMHARGWDGLSGDPREILGSLSKMGFEFWRIDDATGRTELATAEVLCREPDAVFDFVVSRTPPSM